MLTKIGQNRARIGQLFDVPNVVEKSPESTCFVEIGRSGANFGEEMAQIGQNWAKLGRSLAV